MSQLKLKRRRNTVHPQRRDDTNYDEETDRGGGKERMNKDSDDDDDDDESKQEKQRRVEEMFLREVPINFMQMQALDQHVRTHPAAQICMRMLIDNVRANGINATLEIFGLKYELSKSLQEVFRTEWSGLYLEELIWSTFLYGCVVVGDKASSIDKKVRVPRVIAYTTYQATFIEDFHNERQYRIYPMDEWEILQMTSDNNNNSKNTSKTPARMQRQHDEDVRFYVFFKPDSKGNLTSPLSRVLHLLRMSRLTWDNHASADYHRSHPSMALQTSSGYGRAPAGNAATSISTPLENVNYADAIQGMPVSESMQMQTAELSRENTEESIVAHAEMCRHIGSRNPNPFARDVPYGSVYDAPAGRQVAVMPRIELNTQLRDIEEWILISVAQVVGIPCAFVLQDRAMHAANANVERLHLNVTIQSLQKMLVPSLKECFDALMGSVDQFVDCHSASMEKVAITPYGQRFIRANGDASAYQGKSGPVDFEQDRLAVIQRIVGITSKSSEAETFARGNAAEPHDPEESEFQVNAQQLHDMVRNGVSFNISFERSPSAEPEALKAAYDENIIPWDIYARTICSLLGIDPIRALSEKQAYEQMEKRTMQVQGIAKRNPAPKEGGPLLLNGVMEDGGGGGTKPPPKPAPAGGKKAKS